MERFLRGFSHDFECTSSRKKYANCREHIVLKIKTGEGESVEFEVKDGPNGLVRRQRDCKPARVTGLISLGP